MNDDIQDLKSKVDILVVANDLGFLPLKKGTRYQGGKCPGGHDSVNKQCFTIYTETQSAFCFHCHKSWDVIELVKHVKNLDFIGACNWLSDQYGRPRLPFKKKSPEEKAKHEARLEEEKIVSQILTDAARFYNSQLIADDEMTNHVNQHYALTNDTIDSYSLGYSTGSGLWEHLQKLGHHAREIALTGLFIKVGKSRKEFFNHRLIFPYWKSGQVVYFIGRKTARTPDHDWEKGKYKKLQTHVKNRPFISKVVQNDCFYGEDSITGSEIIYVAEGVTDCLAMLQAGYPTISPASTRFRRPDVAHLQQLTRNSNAIYLVPDAEENSAGIDGAKDTSKLLEEMGRKVYIVALPKSEGTQKIDVTDFLRDQGKEAFEKLIAEAKSPLQLQIDDIVKQSPNLIKLSENIAPVKKKLAQMGEDEAAAYLDYLGKAFSAKSDFIKGLNREIKSSKKKSSADKKEDNKPTLSASFPQLVDLVKSDRKISFLYKDHEGYKIGSSYIDESGNRLIPPERDDIPFELLPANKILSHILDPINDLYSSIFKKLEQIAVLPDENYYHLCTIYIFFTYISESCSYYPYLHFHGLPERGKSRITKAMAHLSYRGFYTETLNQAYMFRLADRFRATFALDVYELSKQAQIKGSHDLLLGRYERGHKIPRVTNPDKGAFQDMTYYRVDGPTILATNVDIPANDPLKSRCIKITMPEARGIYSNNNSIEDLLELKERLFAFRACLLGESLPEAEKPVPGRLGDIIQPLFRVSKLLPNEAREGLNNLVQGFEEERKNDEAETLAGRIAQALYDIQCQVVNGRLPVEKITEKINEGIDERFHVAPQTIGRELSAMGIDRKKSGGKMKIIFDKNKMKNIWDRFTPNQDNLPNLPNLPSAEISGDYDREIKNGNLPYPPKDGEAGGKGKNSLLDVKPNDTRKREIGEERETPKKESQRSLFEGQFETGIM